MELRKIQNGETVMKTSKELNEKESYESAMMCWESLDDSEQASKKRKMLKMKIRTIKPTKWIIKRTPNVQQIWGLN